MSSFRRYLYSMCINSGFFRRRPRLYLFFRNLSQPRFATRALCFSASEVWIVHPEMVSLPSVAAIFSGPLHREVDDFATAPLVSFLPSVGLTQDELPVPCLSLLSGYNGSLDLFG